MEFEYSKEKRNNVTVIFLKGDLIEKNQSLVLLNELEALILQGENKFVLDMNQLIHLNSSGLNVIINILTKSRKAGGDIAISRLTPKIKELMVITKLGSIFNLRETIEEAVKILN